MRKVDGGIESSRYHWQESCTSLAVTPLFDVLEHATLGEAYTARAG